MPFNPNYIPKLTHNKATGRGVVRLSGVDVYCGVFGTPECKANYDREVAEWLERGRKPKPTSGAAARAEKPDTGPTVSQILAAYWAYAQQHFRRPDGTQTNEVNEYRVTLSVVRELYGLAPARDFGPLALMAVRRAMIRRGWCRTLVNQRVNRVRRVFKWAAGEGGELIPSEVFHRLTVVTGLQRGRSEAPESEPVAPVPAEVVAATLPHLNRQVRGMVEFQRLTGCRPGEVCAIRRADIDTTGPVWLYRPHQHKTAWRGKSRVVPIGPKAQAVLEQFPTDSPDDFVFSPAKAVAELRARRSANRKTPRFPSHVRRNAAKRKPEPQIAPAAACYRVPAYEHAIAVACQKAFPPPAHLAPAKGEGRKKWWKRLNTAERDEVKAWRSAHRWAPNRLRHSFGTEVRRVHGLEAAQVLLGHTKADVTQVYAERDLALAVEVAALVG